MKTTRRKFLQTAGVFAGATALTGAAAPEGVVAGHSVATREKVPLAPPDKQPESVVVEEAPEKKIGWAVVGLGELALGEVMPAFGQAKLSKPVALVSGHPEKALAVAGMHGISPDAIYGYENFDKIAEDKRIDVVYIVLPNSMHAEYTVRALKAGKHVLCEKPMAVTVEEGQAMQQAAKAAERKLSIAYRLHHEPMNRQVMQWCKEHKFGKVKTFASSNAQQVKAPNIRLSKDLGGGPIGDVGVYSINAARYVFNEEPEEVMAFANQPEDDPRFAEVPESVVFVMRYASGAVASCSCSFGVGESRRYRVECEQGFIEMDPAFSYRGLQLKTRATDGDHNDLTSHLIPEVNHFAAEMDAFSKAILDDTEVITPASMGIADMRIITAIYESLKTGRPAKVNA